MSLIKANAVQIGQSGTATQNFTLAVPSSPDGTIKLARGNSGATTQDVMSVSNAGVVSFPQGFNGTITGNITANVTGNLTGNVTGDVTGNTTGNLIGDVFASNGTSKVLENGTNGTNAIFTGSVIGGTLSGNASSATALATGSTTARTLANRFTDVVNVLDFGAVGDGVTDDYTAIQNAVNYCATAFIRNLLFPNGTYNVSSQILIRQGAVTTSSASGSDIHFMPDNAKFTIYSPAGATIKATAVMESVFKFNPTTVSGAGTYANFYSEINGLKIDGNNLAGIGIFIKEAMHVKIVSNAIYNVVTGIYNEGYAVHDILKNVIRANVCISYSNTGGDSHYEHNDLYINTNGTGFLLRPFASSNLLLRNTFTPVDTSIVDTNTRAIEIRADASGDDVKKMGAIKIIANCFDGVRYGVYARGFSTAIRNITGVEIASNYIGAAGTSTTCDLINVANVSGFNIHDNDITVGLGEPIINSLGILYDSSNCNIHDNSINGCYDDGLILDGDCYLNKVHNNKFVNVGNGTISKSFIRVKGTSYTNTFTNNIFIQLSALNAQNGIIEEYLADYNYADNNQMLSFITKQYQNAGANTYFISRLTQSSPPVTGTWLKGARVNVPFPDIGKASSYVCTASGTSGTWRVDKYTTNISTTGSRPTLTSNDAGVIYLDTTLDADGKPIWWNGTSWIDATGTVV
jgi:hypothetical protein